MARLRKDHWLREIEKLDPDKDYEQISRIIGNYEFPWDVQQALSLALFRTYAVPSIGRLLHDTNAFTENVQKRHDDTLLILFSIANEGLDSSDGRTAVRRMNQMHGSYDISNADMRYVLSAFVVTPTRWIEQYGWRKGIPAEELSAVRYYQRLGQLMGIKDIPETYEEFEELLDTYEAEHFVFDEKSLAVADATLQLFASFYPKPARKAANALLRSLMDDHLLEAFHYPKPSRPVVFLSRKLLRLRARIVALMPPRVSPKRLEDFREVRSYPGGFRLEELGTFPVGCPVPHDRAAGGPN
ncbi:MAG: oxygenase MpaB family protein [Aeromicrobium sp.]